MKTHIFQEKFSIYLSIPKIPLHQYGFDIDQLLLLM